MDITTGKAAILFWTIAALIVLFGTYLRAYDLAAQSYWMDESFAIALAESWSNHGYPLSESGEMIWQRSPVYYWLLSFFVDHAGNEASMRALAVFFGSLTVSVVIAVLLQWWGPITALLGGLLIALDPVLITWSRQTREYTLVVLVFWLAVYVLYRFRPQPTARRWPYIIWSSLLIALLFFAVHRFLAILIAFSLGCTLLAMPSRWRSLANDKVYFILFHFIALAALYAALFLSGTYGNNFPHYAEYLTSAFAFCVPMCFYALVKGHNRHIWVMLLATITVNFIMVCWGSELFGFRYLILLTPVIVALFAHGLAQFIETKNVIAIVFAIFVGFLYGLNAPLIIKPQSQYLLYRNPQDSKLANAMFTPQPDYRKAYQLAMQHAPQTAFVTAYPTLSRLYTDRDDIAVLRSKISHNEPTKRTESNTNIRFINGLGELKQLIATQDGVSILIDSLNRFRVDKDILTYLDDEAVLLKKLGNEYRTNLWIYYLEGNTE